MLEVKVRKRIKPADIIEKSRKRYKNIEEYKQINK